MVQKFLAEDLLKQDIAIIETAAKMGWTPCLCSWRQQQIIVRKLNKESCQTKTRASITFITGSGGFPLLLTVSTVKAEIILVASMVHSGDFKRIKYL